MGREKKVILAPVGEVPIYDLSIALGLWQESTSHWKNMASRPSYVMSQEQGRVRRERESYHPLQRLTSNGLKIYY